LFSSAAMAMCSENFAIARRRSSSLSSAPSGSGMMSFERSPPLSRCSIASNRENCSFLGWVTFLRRRFGTVISSSVAATKPASLSSFAFRRIDFALAYVYCKYGELFPSNESILSQSNVMSLVRFWLRMLYFTAPIPIMRAAFSLFWRFGDFSSMTSLARLTASSRTSFKRMTFPFRVLIPPSGSCIRPNWICSPFRPAIRVWLLFQRVV